MSKRLDETLARIGRALRATVGAPDYDKYLEHVRTAHPGREPLTCEQFVSDRLDRRYNAVGSRCC